MYCEVRNFAVDFNGKTGRFSCFHADDSGRLSAFLRDISIGRGWRAEIAAEGLPFEQREMKLAKKDGSALHFRIGRDFLEIVNVGKKRLPVRGIMTYGAEPAGSTFAVSEQTGAAMLRNACGPAAAPDADLLYDRITDSALKFESTEPVNLRFDWQSGNYRIDFILTGSLRFSIRERVCAGLYNLRQWKSISDGHGFTAPPVGWMTWYAVRFDACEKVVLHNARRMRELFGEYVDKMVIWVDWEWCHRDLSGLGQPDSDVLHPRPEVYPHGLKYVSDRLKKLGFIPALWSGATNDGTLNELFRKHPDWLLGEAGDWCGRYWADCSHPGVIGEYFPILFRQILDWGYQVIKFDCWARTLTHADEFRARRFDPDLSSGAAMRKVLGSVRKVIGEDFYFLGCLVTDRPLQTANDFFDAARIGGDVFTWDEFRENAVGRGLYYYPMHNTAWHLDPDTLVLREEYSTFEQARTRVSFVALTGMMFTVGDPLDALDDARIELLRRAMPTTVIHPQEMALRTKTPDVGITLTSVCRPHGNWYVAGLYNLTGREQTAVFEFKANGLPPGKYAVYDFWKKQFIGVRSGTVRLKLAPGGCAVLRLTPVSEAPELVACTRHILQGADELSAVKRTAASISGKLRAVRGQEVELGFYLPDGAAATAQPGLTVKKGYAGLRICPDRTGEVRWKVNFRRRRG
jgi:hypothetical protein